MGPTRVLGCHLHGWKSHHLTWRRMTEDWGREDGGLLNSPFLRSLPTLLFLLLEIPALTIGMGFLSISPLCHASCCFDSMLRFYHILSRH